MCELHIDDTSAEYEAAGAEWKRGLTTRFGLSESDVVNNIALIDFDSESDLIPLYELVDRDLTEEEDGVDGEARYQAFKTWFETVLLKDPSILTRQADLSSYITTVPTKIEPLSQMADAKTDESLIRDVYLVNGQHVARICSEYIPVINPSKRVSVIYPMVNGKCRYNLGIFCGDEQSYPAKVSWGWEQDPATPVVTSMPEYGKGTHNVAYLRGNHLTLEADPKFQDSEYATTTSSPYTLNLKDNGDDVVYPLVKINNYVYTRNLYRARTYQNGTNQMSDKLFKQGGNVNPFSPYYRNTDATKNVDWYLVSNYTYNLHGWGGFAPQGWTVPYASQYQRMIQDLADVQGSKPDGSMGASFTKGGIYGFNAPQTGCITVGYNSADTDKPSRLALVNEGIIYLGAIDDQDQEKLEATTDIYKVNGSLESGYSCHALAIDPANGTVALTYYKDQAPSYIGDNEFGGTSYYPEVMRNKGSWSSGGYGNPIQYIINIYDNQKNNSKDWPGNHLCYPVVICQQVAK